MLVLKIVSQSNKYAPDDTCTCGNPLSGYTNNDRNQYANNDYYIS